MPERFRFVVMVLVSLWCCPAYAQERDKVESDLAITTKALQTAEEERKELEARNSKLHKELGSLQKDLVAITGKVQQQEKLLSELEANLQQLQQEEREKADKLLHRRKELASMVQTMLKLSRVPPEMVIAMPGDFENTMRTAKVLGLTTSTLSQQAAQISVELAEIQALQTQIKQNHRQISQQKTTLEKDESVLAAKLAERGTIQNQLLSRFEEQERQMKELSEASNTLKELMIQLEDHHEETKIAGRIPVPISKPTATKQQKTASSDEFTETSGRISLPAEGKIFTFYGDQTSNEDESRGISIRTRKGAKVTSPHAGEVMYTGVFLEYGNMVILRHADGYHSLLAGMETISAKLGQHVIKDEPIGEMGRNDDQTALYMEIRKNNRPIDPMPWLETQHYATKR